jgi:TetR/AcrR family transcriptional regulator, mexCD-oprJ operon repressor
MSEAHRQDPRRAIAERNAEAILDAAERLLERRAQPSISAVAAEAGVSRPTVYAHFEDRERLLEALVERAVRHATTALESSEPDRGPAMEALRRLVGSSWQEIGHNEDIGRASAAELSGEAMRRAHESARAVLMRLVERGRREGAFRTDVPSAWLVTSALALIHAAAEAVREGELDADSALAVVTASVDRLFGVCGA